MNNILPKEQTCLRCNKVKAVENELYCEKCFKERQDIDDRVKERLKDTPLKSQEGIKK